MKAEQIYEVIKKLTGPIRPAVDAAMDGERLRNLETFIEVFRNMHMDIDDISYEFKDSPYGSAKKAGLVAKAQLDDMGIPE
jgi:hypothetical protein